MTSGPSISEGLVRDTHLHTTASSEIKEGQKEEAEIKTALVRA